MARIKVAVLCGGPSSEWEVSMKSGAEVRQNLPKEKYDAKLVQIAPDGRWILLDRKRAVPLKIFGADGRAATSDLRKFDLAFNALHGRFGEDGRVQAILEAVGVPYTGSGVLASALGMNKLRTMELASGAGMPVPRTTALAKKDLDRAAIAEKKIKKELGLPLVVKPNASGSSVGITIVRAVKDFKLALKKAFAEDETALVQKYIAGKEMTCGVVGNAGGELTALPPVMIVSRAEFFDYEAKYNSKETRELCPAPVSAALTKRIQELAIKAHLAIGADGLTRSDFIFSGGKFHFLEINTSPGLTAASLCPKEARAYGMEFGEFLDWLCELALRK